MIAILSVLSVSGCTTIQVDAPALARVKRVVILGFFANRDVELALASQSFNQARHDGEDIVPKALPVFTEKLYRMGRFNVLPCEFITTTQAYRAYRPTPPRYRKGIELVTAPKLKIVNGEDDIKVIGEIVKAAGIDGGVVVESWFSTQQRIAEGDTGSVGGRVRIQIKMVNAAGAVVWSDLIEGNSEDLARVSGGTYTFPNEIVKVVNQAFDRGADEAIQHLKDKLP